VLQKIIGSPLYLTLDLTRPYICRYLRSKSGDLIVVDINSWVGLFAHLEWFLEISLYCERQGITPCFMSTSAQYVDPERGPNWFDYFFENLQLSPDQNEKIKAGDVPICRIEGVRQLGLPESYDKQLNLNNAPRLVRKYIGVNREILDKAKAFFKKNLENKSVLGVHYRGTDKSAEAPPIPYEEFKDIILKLLKQNSQIDCLFVSSDEQKFIDFLDNSFRHRLSVFFHDDKERSTTKIAVHRSRTGDRYRKGEEAVINCLLLSKCSALVKTTSIMSGWSKLFNPDLPVTIVNSPFERQLWFPDREFVKAGDGRE